MEGKKHIIILVIFIFILIGVVIYFTLAYENSDGVNIKEKIYTYGEDYFFITEIKQNEENINESVKTKIPIMNKKGIIENNKLIIKLQLSNEKFKLTYLDENEELKKLDYISINDEIILETKGVMYVENKDGTYILGNNLNYVEIGDATIVKKENEPIKIKNVGEKMIFEYVVNKDRKMSIWGAYSKDELFTYETFKEKFNSHKLGNGRELLIDGYYFNTPTSYEPYEENALWRIPSAYITNNFIKYGHSIGESIIGQSMLKISVNNINDEGYIPSKPKSMWLSDEYGYEKYFFDTRFNSDTIETFLVGYIKYGDDEYRNAYLKMGEYYINHVKENKHINYSEDGEEGWLMEDYNQEGNDNKVHSSLNHQLHTMKVFYDIYLEEKDVEYLNVANKMLYGIKNIKDKYIIEDGGLEYAYLPNGEMGFVDYPYLTYNDLFLAQKTIEKIKGYRDDDLDYLMRHKKKQMDRDGITNYKK